MVQVLLNRNARIADRLDALAGVLPEATLQERADRGWCSRRKCAPVGIAVPDRTQYVGNIVSLEQPASGEHLVEHAAERPDVRPPIDDLAARLLRAHVAGGAQDDADLSAAQQRR